MYPYKGGIKKIERPHHSTAPLFSKQCCIETVVISRNGCESTETVSPVSGYVCYASSARITYAGA